MRIVRDIVHCSDKFLQLVAKSRSPHPVAALRVSPTTEAVLDSVVGVVPGGASLDVSVALANMRV